MSDPVAITDPSRIASQARAIVYRLSSVRFPLDNERQLQDAIEKVLVENKFTFEREYQLDKKNRPDFFTIGIAIETKIKGSKREIYKQCERYCQFSQVQALILVTNRSMGFPQEINGKPCYIVNLGKAWL